MAEVQTLTLQTVILLKTRFKTRSEALKWMRDHAKEQNLRFNKIDETETSFRFRQRTPALFDPLSFRTKRIDSGILFVFGKLKQV